ncbi:ABC transporter substrate-binding protein [Aliidiomarina sanyensis]|uniref:ABC transporter substrate-binding protein n=1 Tax=Aliidiomarina sanyensis TaxID=1249555 RepID=A0A432WKJ8_9GAMM|nr:ABC transporter substrate-binding protein [Aliidiomarina sanyensis]RUO34219.1 ABC transporter substrate-binding protein [Aliidiomarina sanyensis]
MKRWTMWISALCLPLTWVATSATYASTDISGNPNANATADRIHWVVNTAPPFHVVSGPLQGQGICDVLMEAVKEALPDVQSTRYILPQTRIRQQFDRNENQCFPCMIYRPEAVRGVAYSKPTHFYYPHGIITTAVHARRIRETYGEPLPLRQFLRESDLRFGYPAGRVYGDLQPILEEVSPDDSYRVVHTGENATLAILAMIKAGRIDYTIDYQILAEFDRQVSGNTLEFIEIEETAGAHILGAIGCTDNAWGHAIIEQINNVMPRVRENAQFLQVLDQWFRHKPESTPYRELLRDRVWNE